MTEPPLLPLGDAIRTVLDETPAPRVEPIPLADAVGLVLAEPVVSDTDLPPFDRATMDGFAVRSADLAEVPAELRVTETIHAGDVSRRGVGPGEAARIMTGAPAPDGADAVVPVERTEPLADGRVRIHRSPGRGENVAPRGEDCREGDVVLAAGRRIGPAEAGVLAAVGRVAPLVFAPPKVLVLTTGDEVVPPSERPAPGRIRNSNSPGLLARLARDRARAADGGNLPDDLDATREALERAVGAHDVVIVTGGVSMGERDLVLAAAEAAGLRLVFHRIRLKPGKPVLFGTAGGSLLFGLPGNPVSVAVTYEVLVRPAVRKLAGLRPLHRPRVAARLVSDPPDPLPREQLLPARLARSAGGWSVETLRWRGSGDLVGFSAANALLVVPAGGPAPRTGEEALVVVLDDSPDYLIEAADDGGAPARAVGDG